MKNKIILSCFGWIPIFELSSTTIVKKMKPLVVIKNSTFLANRTLKVPENFCMFLVF